MPLGEFQLIEKYFSHIGRSVKHPNAIALGIGDDAALLNPPAGQQLAISVDTLVAGVHFPAAGDARLIAHKALRVNLSDLAAMGAQPLAFTLALTLSEIDQHWLAEFSRGLAEVADEFDLALIGGDTTRGAQLVITLQIIGTLPHGQALLRSGARAGDNIFVTGTLGDARAALDILDMPHERLTAPQRYLLERYHQPTPRLAFAQALRGIASSAIDISDGLAADLGHILERSGVDAELRLTALPLSAALINLPHAQQYALCGGDDYELCFTAAPAQAEKIRALAAQYAITVTQVGQILDRRDASQSKLNVRDINGDPVPVARAGYTHF